MATIEDLGRALANVPPNLRQEVHRIWYEATDAEFWQFYDYLLGLKPRPLEKSADEYIRSVDPSYWSEEELLDVLW